MKLEYVASYASLSTFPISYEPFAKLCANKRGFRYRSYEPGIRITSLTFTPRDSGAPNVAILMRQCQHRRHPMSFLADLLRGAQIADVHVDSEVTYLMLSNGTQVTVR